MARKLRKILKNTLRLLCLIQFTAFPPLYFSDVQGFTTLYRTSVKDCARFVLIVRKKWIVNILDFKHCFRKMPLLPIHPMKGETSLKWSIPLMRSGRL
jgi:hypothetical protein